MKSKSFYIDDAAAVVSILERLTETNISFFCTYDLMVVKDLVGGAWWQDHITFFLFKRKDNFGLIELTGNGFVDVIGPASFNVWMNLQCR